MNVLRDYDDISSISQEDCQKMYPGFTIRCQRCGGVRVGVRDTLAFSETSGSWGEVTLECADCKNSVDIVNG